MIVNTAQSMQNTPPSSAQQDLGSKDIFLRILIAQMQNQDPLKPQDAAQMSTQLAQFNMVEQQIDTNKLLTAMLSDTKSTDSEIAAASSFLGHTLSARTSRVSFDGSSPLKLAFDMAGNVPKEVRIVDSSGFTVRTFNLDRATNTLTWDGISDSGSMANPGMYDIRITATDINGQPVAASTQVVGQATAVRLTEKGVFVMIGSTPVTMADITVIQ